MANSEIDSAKRGTRDGYLVSKGVFVIEHGLVIRGRRGRRTRRAGSGVGNDQNLLRNLRFSADATVGNGAAAEEIQQAEAALDCRFPEDYKLFLRWCGWGGRADWEIFGLGGDVPPYLDLVRITREERTDYGPGLPYVLLPVLNDGGAYMYCLKLDESSGGICPVVAWHLESDEPAVAPVSSSFAAWLATLP